MRELLLNFFQHPGFLAVLVAVLIPPIVEWLLRRRRRRIPFAAMRYLLDPEQPKKIKLQDRILLILRMVILFWIVLALARPLLRPEDVITLSRKDRAVVMLFDATYSNAQRVGNASAFGTAQRMAHEVLNGLPEGVPIAAAAMGHSLRVVQDWSTDKALLRERIDELKVTHGAGGLRDGLAWAEAKVKEKGLTEGQLAVEVYIFSDLQEQTWLKGDEEGQGNSVRALLPRLTERAQVFVAATGGENAVNVYVDRFEPLDKVLAVGVTTEFAVGIRTSNLAQGRSVTSRLTLYVNDEKRHFETLQVPAEGLEARVPYTALTDGEQVLKVVIDGDDSPLDNERLFLADVPSAMKVLVLDDDSGLAPAQRPSVFWEFAVAPPSAPGRDPVSAFTVQTANWDEAQKENFGEYGAVVLANVREMPPGLVSRLAFYAQEGGCLLVFTGEGIEPYAYERLHRGGEGPLPAVFREKQPVSAQVRPALPGMGELKDGALRFVRQLGPPGKGKEEARILAQLSSGQPLVLSRRFGQGRCVLVAADPSLKWGSLPLDIDFPVFVQELLRAVLGDPNRLVNLNVGDVFAQPVLISTQQLLLKTPANRRVRLTPEQVPGEELPRLAFSETDVQGLYQLDAPPGVLARRRFVVNLNPEESDMNMWDRSGFSGALGGNVLFLSPHENVTKRVESMHALREFAGLILFLVFVLLLLESFLAMRFGLRKG